MFLMSVKTFQQELPKEILVKYIFEKKGHRDIGLTFSDYKKYYISIILKI
jgi:hypothetical protein